MFTLNCKGRLLIIDQPIIMGILNVTDDSFYEGSRLQSLEEVLRKAEKMLNEGATILDIGGQSTRPGSTQIAVEDENRRVLPAIEAIKKNFPEAYISIDTYQSIVAANAIQAGADIINDISAGSIDNKIIDIVAKYQLPYILMHMQGTPATMQLHPQYENVTQEILDFFIQKIGYLKSKGIADIIIDPGFGFGKTIQHNFRLLKELSVFGMLELPILLGISRKATIYKTLEVTPADALNGTTTLNTIGLLNGANILRVHDVKAAQEAMKLTASYWDS